MSTDLLLGRQPILDRAKRVAGFELLFRERAAETATVDDPTAATASVMLRALSDLGIEAALGPHRGYVNFDTAMIFGDTIELLPPDRFVIEILEHVVVDDALVARCRELKELGYVLALDDFVGQFEAFAPLLDLVDVVKVDVFALRGEVLRRTVRALDAYPARLLAEKVETQDDFRICAELGFDLFQGYFFARPTITAARTLDHTQLGLLRILGMVIGEAENEAIENLLKHEPGLALRFLTLANSAAVAPPQPISSVRQGIVVLGRRQLLRWLQLLLYAATGPESGGGALLHWAATRGRFIEMLAEAATGDRETADRGFMVGVLSLMPCALGAPMEELVRVLPLPLEVREALLQQVGPLGSLLVLAERLDEPQGANFAAAPPLGLDPERISRCLTAAMAWANAVGGAGGE